MGRYIYNALSDLAKALYRLIDIAMEHDLSSDEWMELEDLKSSSDYIRDF